MFSVISHISNERQWGGGKNHKNIFLKNIRSLAYIFLPVRISSKSPLSTVWKKLEVAAVLNRLLTVPSNSYPSFGRLAVPAVLLSNSESILQKTKNRIKIDNRRIMTTK